MRGVWAADQENDREFGMDIRYRAVMQRIIDGTPTATQSAELTGGAAALRLTVVCGGLSASLSLHLLSETGDWGG